MTETTDVPATAGMSEDEKQLVISGIHEKLAKQDYELQSALEAAIGSDEDKSAVRFLALTVVTSGGTLSGEAISRAVWQEHLHSKFAGTIRDAMAEEEKFLAKEREMVRKARAELEVPDPPRRYIHMRKAVLINGGRSVDLGFTRVYVKDIIAWTLGRLGD